MDAPDSWDLALLIVAGLVAVSGLVRLMLVRRNRRLAEIQAAQRLARPSSSRRQPDAKKEPAPAAATKKSA